MFRFWRRSKRWVRWTLSAVFAILVTIGAVVGYFYYQIKSIELADIQARIEARHNGGTAPSTDKQLPSIMDNTIDKANQFASKSVNTQDALDVAAILLNSGLSLKEVYYLIGQSTEKLSTAEKQKIRDLLLAKLTVEEIQALRSITTEYGKGLIILDRNYPIELVGVYDEVERAKVMKELEQRKVAANEAYQTPTSSIPVATPSPTPSPSSTAKPTSTPSETPPGTTGAELKSTYAMKLTNIQTTCTSQVNRLTQEIINKLSQPAASGQTYSLQELQNTFLPQVIEAEQQCDQSFNQLMTEAEHAYSKAGLGLEDVAGWRTQYTTAKNQVRQEALGNLISALKKG
ncbi:hypothetical protein [Paenibacillus koleovorans]|uniref:hypothetical protein n=1 Tax=Paenibacillus koleovorans TaxID=121608 RepID=UPI000FD87EB9|nr:hypothetical protein [Paenibacillus koleovorans]